MKGSSNNSRSTWRTEKVYKILVAQDNSLKNSRCESYPPPLDTEFQVKIMEAIAIVTPSDCDKSQ